MRLVLLAFGLIALALCSMALGSFAMSPAEVLHTTLGAGSRQQEIALFQIRLPRLAMAALVGAGLALSGTILQGVSRNVLADPGLLGLNAGTGLVIFVLLYLRQMHGQTLPGWVWPFAAFAGAALAAAVIWSLARKHGAVEPGRMILAGIAVNAGLSALALVISMRLDQRLYASASTWLAGSLSGAKWAEVMAILPWLLLAAPVLALSARALDLLALGDDAATGLGVRVEARRLALISLAVALAGASVALAGGIAFVGLLAPHIARRITGPAHARLLPAAAVTGAGLMILADLIGRNLIAPVELPVGVVVAVIGAPYFLFLLMRTD